MPRKGELEEGLTYNLLRNSILFQVNKSYIKPSLWPYSVFQSSFLYYWRTQKSCTQKFASLLSIIHSETVQGHLLIYFHPSVMTAEEVSALQKIFANLHIVCYFSHYKCSYCNNSHYNMTMLSYFHNFMSFLPYHCYFSKNCCFKL